MEKHITFNCEGYSLEGKLASVAPNRVAVITPPHPLYGGDMDNPVVEVISKAYQKNGWSTLRFNFRGTGGSGGRFDQGDGEQHDVDAAIALVTEMGVDRIELSGYSFGAWVLALRSRNRSRRAHPLRLIAPPVDFLNFEPIREIAGLEQVIAGTNDEFAACDRVMMMTSLWNGVAQFNAIKEADHFFSGRLDDLRSTLEKTIDKIISKAVSS